MNKKMNSMVKEAKELLSDYLEQNTYDFSIDNFFVFDNFIVFNITEYCNSNYDLIVANINGTLKIFNNKMENLI